MTSERRNQLQAAGIDVESALERVMGNEALVERLLGKFPDAPQYSALCTALERGDPEQAAIAAHTLKGVCGNLSMTALFPLFTTLVETLRAGRLDEARGMMAQIAPSYEAAAAAIRGHADGGA